MPSILGMCPNPIMVFNLTAVRNPTMRIEVLLKWWCFDFIKVGATTCMSTGTIKKPHRKGICLF